MVAFIDEHRDEHGVEPICQVLQIAPSTYWRHKQLQRQPELRSARAVRHEELTAKIVKVHADNYDVYGYRKVHAELARQGVEVGEDQVRTLMARAGLKGDTGPCVDDHDRLVWQHLEAAGPGRPRLRGTRAQPAVGL